MATLRMVNARMRRKLIKELAGENYIHGEKVIEEIPYLQQFSDEQFLFGIKEAENKWTVLSVNKIFCQFDGKPFSVNLNHEAEVIHDFYGEEGHKEAVDVYLDNGRKIWMKSVGLSCSIQNIILMLQKLPDKVILE